MPVSKIKSRSQPGINDGRPPDDWCPVCVEGPAPCVPEGTYEATCVGATKYTNPRFKRVEIALTFKLAGAAFVGTEIKRFYSADTAGRKRSNYYREWIIANGGIAPSGGQKMPYKKFKGKLFRIRVGTVRTDASQEKLPAGAQYSKVSAILELIQTNEPIP